MNEYDHRSLIDGPRSAHLCDVGMTGYLAATAIDCTGTEHLVLVESASLGDDTVVCDPTCSAVVHEQHGRLPVEWRDRVWGDELRCNRPRKSGGRCRHRVAEPGASCQLHAGSSSR